MSGAKAAPRTPRRRWIPIAAGVAVAATLVTGAVVAEGYEAQEVPRLESAVWVTRDSGQYARVNTELGELDTVRAVDDPAGVVQSGPDGVVFTQGNRRWWSVDPASPADLVNDRPSGGEASDGVQADDGAGSSADASAPGGPGAEGAPGDGAGGPASESTPNGTREVVASGRYLVYRTDAGAVFVATIGPDGASAPIPVDPYADRPGGATEAPDGGEDGSREAYQAAAVAVDDTGLVALYSAVEHSVRRFDLGELAFRGGPSEVRAAPAADASVELALVGGRWVLSEAAEGRLWIDGADPIATGLGADARLQASDSSGDRVLIADSGGLVSIELATGAEATLAEASGVPAAPAIVDGIAHAAWLSPSGGSLWSSDAEGVRPLVGDGEVLDEVQAIAPVLRSNGDRVVLNETSSGLVWTVPDGRLIPLAQWSQDDETQQEAGTVEVDDVAEQQPPVAVADAFGVRPGSLVSLPLLLNDSDPNKKDVLSIAPRSISGGLSDPGFGSLGLVGNDQTAVVRVQAQSGSATFSYAVTDGAAVSAPATVTLTVVPEGVNSAPAWCGVEGCVAPWPSPQLAPGGTATIAVLPGWVDPEGDPFVLADARVADPEAPLTVVPTADGRLALRHTDPNGADETIAVELTVTDAAGASSEKTLQVSITSAPALVAAPVAVVAGAGEVARVVIADHVSGGSGSFRLLDAAPSSPIDGLAVVPNTAAGEVEISATAPGDYAVTYSVQDAVTLAEQSAVLRLTVVDGQAPLAIPPLTAFVRPNEDTTVDVLGAVQNTSGRVLAVAGATSPDPALDVDVVGQDRVRVSGTTPDGAPGRIATAGIQIADGSGAAIEGALTVFLVAPSAGLPPIAVPDAATVRAGSAIDIPVTANDVSPRGERLVVHPDVEGSGAEGELAFASGQLVRYLAPESPGVYTVRYSIFLENAPERLASAAVTVTVLPPGTNRPPQPAVLSARVLAGHSVSIPVPPFGMDPDGDRVVLVDVAQPDVGRGVAVISAEGDAIVYTAPGGGAPGGQVSFAYTVRDPESGPVSGTVRVGVIDPERSDAAPIAFSDYARVQRGSAASVVVEPLRNDRDPSDGELELVELVPNAPDTEGNPEYARLAALIDPATSLEQGRVVLRAGEVSGPASFVYTVRSTTSSSTSQGLIVLTVTDAASPDQPVVADTVVTALNRGELESGGIDVVSGKVRWPSGETDSLELSVWGPAAASYSVDGTRIVGPLPRGGALVPFTLSGEDATGGEVTAHGFLRIPAFEDLRVQPRSGLAPLQVDEEKSIGFRVDEVLDLAPSDRVELRADPSFRVQRQNASCVPDGDSGAVYASGREAPWTDSCLIAVRLDGQSTWSMVAVPVAIRPKDPLAILSAVSRTVAPGASESIDLYDSMTSWEGGRVGDRGLLDYTASYSGSAFTVTQAGGVVTAEAHADARPGTRETVQIAVSSFGGLGSIVELVVGVAPKDAPRGGTFTTSCEVSAGPSCQVQVVGVAGEYDPFAGKTGAGLKLVSVDAAGSRCEVASISAAGSTGVVASWPAGPTPPGGQCLVPFTVADAQGRTGQGTLTIDVQGYPGRPESVSTAGYDGGGVELDVVLGEANLAHPSVTGVSILEGGRDVGAACSPGRPGVYRCAVGGLTNGEQHQFTARAVNQVGASLDTSPVTTWAYRAPVVSEVVATPVYEPGRTDRGTAVVELAITSSPDARSFRIQETGQTFWREGDVTRTRITMPPGSHPVTIVPSSQFSPPTGDAGSDGAGLTSWVDAAGSPYFDGQIRAVAPNNTTIEASGLAPNGNGAAPVQTVYLAWISNEPSCSDDGSGGLRVNVVGDAHSSSTPTITGLTEYRNYWVKACTSNGFGIAESGRDRTSTDVTVPAPGGNTEYSVGTGFVQDGRSYRYESVTAPTPTNEDGFWTVYEVNGRSSRDFRLDPDESVGTILARQCRQGWFGDRCSDGTTTITPVDAGAAWTARVTFTAEACVPDTSTGSRSRLVESVSWGASGSWTISSFAADPDDATTAIYTLTWSGPFASLDPITRTIPICAPDPPDPEDPEDPDPEEPPTDETDPGETP